MNERLKGMFVPILTPFDDEKLSIPKLVNLGEKLWSSKVKGLFVLGSNGEASHLTDDEALTVVRELNKLKPKDKTTIAGAPRQSAYATIELAKRVEDIGGIDYFLILTPHYFLPQMNDAAMIDFFTRVADSLSTPVLLYNCPKFAAGVTLSEEVVGELSKHPNIVGMKDSSAGNIHKYVKFQSSEFSVLSGTINTIFEGLSGGAPGGIVAMSNYLPDATAEICSRYFAGDVEGAGKLAEDLKDLHEKSAGKLGVPGVKAATKLLGTDTGEGRSPLIPCTEAERELIRRTLEEYGYLKT